MRFTIQHLSGSRAGLQQQVEGTVVVFGRDPSCQVAFDPVADDQVSARHAQAAVVGEGLVLLSDLGSRNGTFLDGQRLSGTPAPLRSGAVVRLGDAGPRLQVSYGMAPAMTATAAAAAPVPVSAPGGGGRGLLGCVLALATLGCLVAGLVAVLLWSRAEPAPEADPGQAPAASPVETPAEPAPAPSPSRPAGPALAHVKVGQVWVFSGEPAPGVKFEQRWEVLEKQDGKVRYRVSAATDMGQGPQSAGDPQEQEWPGQAGGGEGQQPAEEPRWEGPEELEVSGVRLSCRIYLTDAGGQQARTWVPYEGDAPTFPPFLKSEVGGKVSLELRAVESKP